MSILPLDLATGGETKTFYIQAQSTSTTKGDAKIVMTHDGQEIGKKESTTIDLDVKIANACTLPDGQKTAFIVNHGKTCGETTCTVTMKHVAGLSSFTVYLSNEAGGTDVLFTTATGTRQAQGEVTLFPTGGAGEDWQSTFTISTKTPDIVSRTINDIVIDVHTGSPTGQILHKADPTAIKVDVEYMTFWGNKLVWKDNAEMYSVLDWKDTDGSGSAADHVDDNVSPICYAANSTMRLDATLGIQGPNLGGATLKVQGTGRGFGVYHYVNDYRFEDGGTISWVAGDLNSFRTGEMVCSQALPGYMEAFLEAFGGFRISWEVSFDNGGTWIESTTTANPLYVTLGEPKLDQQGDPRLLEGALEKAFEYVISANWEPVTNAADIVRAITMGVYNDIGVGAAGDRYTMPNNKTHRTYVPKDKLLNMFDPGYKKDYVFGCGGFSNLVAFLARSVGAAPEVWKLSPQTISFNPSTWVRVVADGKPWVFKYHIIVRADTSCYDAVFGFAGGTYPEYLRALRLEIVRGSEVLHEDPNVDVFRWADDRPRPK